MLCIIFFYRYCIEAKSPPRRMQQRPPVSGGKLWTQRISAIRIRTSSDIFITETQPGMASTSTTSTSTGSFVLCFCLWW